MSLTELIDFENRLAKALGKKVDAVGGTEKGPKTEFAKTLEGKEIPLYERQP
jgi:hypothetical protein